MRKVILYLFLLGLLISNSQSGYAFALVHEAPDDIAIQKETKQPQAIEYITEYDSILHKGDLINELADYDECDCEEHETSVREKVFTATVRNTISAQSSIHFITIPFCKKSYHYLNFSRLPRFDYMTLCVLRL